MNLAEATPIATTDLPIGALGSQLRLGTGFADGGVQDGVLERALRAALAQVEAITGKALLRRAFVLSLHDWRHPGRQSLPRVPLASFDALTLVEAGGERWTISRDDYHVESMAHGASIVAKGFALPRIGPGCRAELRFTAGHGTWAEVPGDLAAATLAWASALYEDRVGGGAMPPGVGAMLAPHRAPRLWGAA